MSPQYSVIDNGRLPSMPVSVRPSRLVERGDARALLRDRLLHLVGDEYAPAGRHIDPSASGMVVLGAFAEDRLQRLRRAHPSMPLIIEPRSLEAYGAGSHTPFDPVLVPGGTSAALAGALDLMREAGSDIALTPTGQIGTLQAQALMGAVRVANDLDRDDIVLSLPLTAGWLSDPFYTDALIRSLNVSAHPVALSFVDPRRPVGSARRMKAYRRVFQETSADVIAYRTDLAGFDARAHGAIGAAIGAMPSYRRSNPVGREGGPTDRTVLAPHLFVGDLGQFVPSKLMREDWFVSQDAIICSCTVCQGRPLTRLFHFEPDRREGHLHNVVELERLHAATVGLTPTQMHGWWHAYLLGVADTYPQLSTYLGRAIPIPQDIQTWSIDHD